MSKIIFMLIAFASSDAFAGNTNGWQETTSSSGSGGFVLLVVAVIFIIWAYNQ